MNTHDTTGDDPIERDPTGIRALLSSLPDPGPMPADLVARILASLEDERTAPSARVLPFTGASPAGAASTLDGSPRFGSSRARWVRSAGRGPGQRRAQWLGAAAAVVVVASVGGAALVNDRFGSWTATLAGGSGSSVSSLDSAAMSAGSSDAGGAGNRAGLEAAPSVTVHFSNRAYARPALATDAAQLLAAPGQPVTPLAAESPGIGPIGTPIGARDCATTLGIPGTLPLVVDLGTFDGAPAAVLVSGAPGAATAYAVSRSCDLLAGPVVVP